MVKGSAHIAFKRVAIVRREHPRVASHDAASTSSPTVALKPRHTPIARVCAVMGIEEAIDAVRHGEAPIKGADHTGTVKSLLCALAFIGEINRDLLTFSLRLRMKPFYVFEVDLVIKILNQDIPVLPCFGHRVYGAPVELWRGNIVNTLTLKEGLINARLAAQFARPA